MLQSLAPNLWELNAPMTVVGMEIGHRMTVARLRDDTLWVHSPVVYTPELAAALAALGPVQHVVAPNFMHDTYLEGWFAAYPRARFYAPKGMSKVRPDLRFTDTLGDTPAHEWAGTFLQHLIRGMPRLNEVVFLHRSTRTLIVTDLVFNLGPDLPFLTRALLKLNGCDCKLAPSRLLKSTFRDRTAVRASLDQIFAWDFDRVVVSHGDNLSAGGNAKLRAAFAFL
ncbi:MAG: DUF4336 domain-containing protein [Verrucomicrobiota bacterium]